MSGGGQNNTPAKGGITGLLAKAPDPLGISNGGGGLDPLNLMGSYTSPGAPSTLPNLGAGSMQPRYYTPNLSGSNANLGPGRYNAMASALAGPMYSPTPRPQPQPQQPQQLPAAWQLMGGMALNPLLRQLQR